MNEKIIHSTTDSLHTDSLYKIYTEQGSAKQNIDSGEVNNEAFPYIVFGVPIALVFFVAIFKYVFWRIPNTREASKVMLEICIDVLTVGATILFANYNQIGSPGSMFWFSIFLVVAMLISLIIRSLNMDGKLSGYGIWLILLCPLFCLVAIIWLFTIVC